MIAYLIGKITSVGADSVEIEAGSLGYEALVSRPEDYKVGDEGRFYAYEIISEDEHSLAVFNSLKEKQAFLSLIKVKGIGPKTALGALSKTTPEALQDAILSNNTSYLKKLPGIGAKAASQIILDLKGTLSLTGEKGNPNQYEDVRQGLKTLKFKAKEIDEVLSSINMPGATNEEIMLEALRKLRSYKK